MPSSKTKKSSKTRDNKFGVDTIQFPDYLGTKELNQYVLFNINIRGKSELDKNKIKAGSEIVRTGSAQLDEEALAGALTKTGDIAALGFGVSKFNSSRAETARKNVGAGVPRGAGTLKAVGEAVECRRYDDRYLTPYAIERFLHRFVVDDRIAVMQPYIEE